MNTILRPNKFFFIFLIALLTVPFVGYATEKNNQTQFHYDGVLDTSLDVVVYHNDKSLVKEKIKGLMSELIRFEKILSTYDQTSEISQLNKNRSTTKLSKDLQTVLAYCEEWFKRSNNQFSCRLAQLKKIWLEAEKQQQVPNRVQVRKKARNIKKVKLVLPNKDQIFKLPDNISFDTDGLVKGYIIDKALLFLKKELPKAAAIKIDIGGDAIYWGKPNNKENWQVGISHPNNTTDHQSYFAKLALTSMAIASSGHSSRYREINRRRFSHIISANDGWPVHQANSATVIAPNAVTADAIATMLTTMTLNEGVDFVNNIPEVEAIIFSPKGIQSTTQNWEKFRPVVLDKANSYFKLLVNYTIPKVDSNQYRNPYLAIWITDAKNKVIRNLLLLGENERWAEENYRWWRKAGRKDADLIDGIARPTRRPGHYKVEWNGLNDFGQYQKINQYMLHIEASREHGGHDYLKTPILLSKAPFEIKLEEKGEIGKTLIQYIPLHSK